jgi:hypothetical protein
MGLVLTIWVAGSKNVNVIPPAFRSAYTRAPASGDLRITRLCVAAASRFFLTTMKLGYGTV